MGAQSKQTHETNGNLLQLYLMWLFPRSFFCRRTDLRKACKTSSFSWIKFDLSPNATEPSAKSQGAIYQRRTDKLYVTISTSLSTPLLLTLIPHRFLYHGEYNLLNYYVRPRDGIQYSEVDKFVTRILTLTSNNTKTQHYWWMNTIRGSRKGANTGARVPS